MKPMRQIIVLLLTILCGTVCAQTYDTVSGKDGVLPHYYYPEGWFDTCHLFYETGDTPERWPNHPEEWGSFKVSSDIGGGCPPASLTTMPFTAYSHHVEGPVAFTGVAVMMEKLHDIIDRPPYLDTVFTDTIYFLCPDTSGELAVVGSVSCRWDTAARKVWKFPIHVDSAVYGFRHVFLYDLKFDHPVVVDSLYYIYGTNYNMSFIAPDAFHSCWIGHPYVRCMVYVHYIFSLDPSGIEPLCNPYQDASYMAKMTKDGIVIYEINCPGDVVDWWGPYLLMIDSCTIEVGSADSAMGTAGPTRSMSKWVTQTITATPEYGYRFSHWNDGNTENPRDIYLTQDTHFVAYFEPHPRHTILTRCVPEGKGIVYGGGLYWDGDSVTLTARPIAPYVFHHWDDGNRDNPRHFIIEQDTALTAFLTRQDVSVDTVADAEALFTLTPNPTTGSVCCIIGGGAFAGGVLTMLDASGREVLRKELPPETTSHTISLTEYPKGVYFVTIDTPQGSETQKLVIK